MFTASLPHTKLAAIQQTRSAFPANTPGKKERNTNTLKPGRAMQARRLLASSGSPYLRHSPQCNYKITRHMLLQHLDPPCNHRDPYRKRKPLHLVRQGNGFTSPCCVPLETRREPCDERPAVKGCSLGVSPSLHVHKGKDMVRRVDAAHCLCPKDICGLFCFAGNSLI